MLAVLSKILESTSERSSLIKKNILISFFLKGGSVIITFLLVPLTINYINPVQYGIWLTISALIYWISVFDLGIGNGLKNEIAHSIAIKDERNLKRYVSTSYAVLTLISISIFLFFYFISFFFDWNELLNISDAIDFDIRPVLILFIGFFCIQFVIQLLDAVISAVQQVYISSLILFIGQLLGLISIYLLTLYVPGSLLLLVLVMAGSSVSVILVSSIYLYSTKLKKFAPSFKHIDFDYIKKILKLGGAFFFIQIGAMALIHSNNIIISRILGPEAVTTYFIPYRLFSFVTMLFIIIITPYWSAFTDAYSSKDIDWIKSNIKKLRYIWLSLTFLGLVIFLLSDFLYKVWIDDAVKVPVFLSFVMLINVIVFMWHTLHVFFLNGIGKIRLQLFVILIGAIVNIILAILLGNIFGLPGVVGANSLVFGTMALIYTIQYKKIISNKAVGLWNR